MGLEGQGEDREGHSGRGKDRSNSLKVRSSQHENFVQGCQDRPRRVGKGTSQALVWGAIST